MSKLTQIWHSFKENKLNLILAFLLILIVLLSFVYFRAPSSYISFDEYQNLLTNKLIEDAYIEGDKVYVKYGGRFYVVLKDSIDLPELFRATKISKPDEHEILELFAVFFGSMMLFYGVVFFINRRTKERMDEFNKRQIHLIKTANQNRENFIKPTISSVKFSDVAGIDEVKSELSEIVDFLKNPEIYRKFGVKLPKGILMAGAPGVGKTLIAKAVAGEAGVPFFYQNGASFAEIYVGVGAKRVRELFAIAKSHAPAIIFIDEIDAVGKARGDGRNDEREATLNELLTQIDGFEDSSGVIIIGATNKIDMIDDALLRPGRFDRRVFVGLPNFKERVEIFKIHLKNKSCDVDLNKISRISVGFSGAAIATFVNEAAVNAVRRKSPVIELIDFENVKNRVAFGKKKELILDETEKQIQSYYQGAKALCAFWFGVEFEKISLFDDDFIRRDREIFSKSELMNELKALLAGYAALLLYKNDKFNLARGDIARANELAHKMVFEYAMGDGFLRSANECADTLQSAFDEANSFLQSVPLVLNEIAKYIFINENIDKKRVEAIYHEILQV